MSDWRAALLAWYRAEGRDLPWRRTRDPYAVWVSEAMLQQTTVATALPYYERWMARFPDVTTLATADEEEALALWSGLGYYRRCRNLQAGAMLVIDNGWPSGAESWRRMPGVGAYTAAALASIVDGEAAAVVDGNVVRVFARFMDDGSCGPSLQRAASSWAQEVVCPEAPGEWNQAMMELGATVCRPAGPRCGECPVAAACRGRASGRAAGLPVRAPKPEVKRLQRAMVVPVRDGRVGFRKIEVGPWWRGLWECPQETNSETWLRRLDPAKVLEGGRFTYIVTRHKVELDVVVALGCRRDPGLEWRVPAEANELALTSPTRRALALAPVVRAAGEEASVQRPGDGR